MDNDDYDKLFHAAKYGISSDVLELIDKGVDINVRNKSENTPLIVALISSQPDTAIKLIEAGANLNLADRESNTPLMLAIQNNMRKVYTMLITKGCNVTLRNKYNETALNIAAKTSERILSPYHYHDHQRQVFIERTMDLFKLLIPRGCDVNVIDTSGRTPLTIAIETRSIETTELLLNHGADSDSLYCNLTFDLWFYPLDPLLLKILKLLLQFQYKCICNKSRHCSQAYLNEHSSETYDDNMRLDLIRLAHQTGSCSNEDLWHLLYDSDFKYTWQSNETIRKLLKNECNCPMSLKDLCRIAIFKYLKPNREVNIRKLEIPQELKSFLSYI